MLTFKTTIIGPYPRVSSEKGALLRVELNKLIAHLAKSDIIYHSDYDTEKIRKLKLGLTEEIVKELSSFVDLPNHGLVDVYDELTWPLENIDGVEFTGIKKVFHTNTHYRGILVNGEIARKKPIVNNLYFEASKFNPNVKLEFPGPYTLALHSVISKNSPYRNVEELARAYAFLYRQELGALPMIPFVQFNEPSLVAFERKCPKMNSVPEIYAEMLKGLKVQTAVWTFYGTYSQATLDVLLAIPVDFIGFDFVWNDNLESLLKKISFDKGIGFGILDSGDRGSIFVEDAAKVARRLNGLKDYIDFERALIAPNATLEHLPRDYARRKLEVLAQLKEELK